MVSAITSDLLALPDIDIQVLGDASLSPNQLAEEVQITSVSSKSELEDQFDEACRGSDGVVLIAPEIHGELLSWVQRASQNDVRLLGPSVEFVELTSDKWLTYEHFRSHGIPTPETHLVSDLDANAELDSQCDWLLKPRWGAGSHGIRFIEATSSNVLRDQLPQLVRQEDAHQWLIQHRASGRSVSVSSLTGPGQRLSLPATDQLIAGDGTFAYQGSRGPLPTDLNERAARLGRRVLDELPPSTGYVGIDLILGEASDGSQDSVIEVNPRLTTSYLLLRKLTHPNIASIWLDILNDDEVSYAFSSRSQSIEI